MPVLSTKIAIPQTLVLAQINQDFAPETTTRMQLSDSSQPLESQATERAQPHGGVLQSLRWLTVRNELAQDVWTCAQQISQV